MESKKLEYYVFEIGVNTNEIKWFNIFNQGVLNDIRNVLKNKEINTKSKFKDELKKIFMYYYWSKCEHEVLISPWPPKGLYEGRLNKRSLTINKDWYTEGEDLQYECKNPEMFEKIKRLKSGEFYLQNQSDYYHIKMDVYEQIKRNLDLVTDIVLKHYDRSFEN